MNKPYIEMILFVYGLVVLHLWLAILGGVTAMLSKLWYADRVVWLYEDMEHLPEYGNWVY